MDWEQVSYSDAMFRIYKISTTKLNSFRTWNWRLYLSLICVVGPIDQFNTVQGFKIVIINRMASSPVSWWGPGSTKRAWHYNLIFIFKIIRFCQFPEHGNIKYMFAIVSWGELVDNRGATDKFTVKLWAIAMFVNLRWQFFPKNPSGHVQ